MSERGDKRRRIVMAMRKTLKMFADGKMESSRAVISLLTAIIWYLEIKEHLDVPEKENKK